MQYILDHSNQFRSAAIAFILPAMQILAALQLEMCFMIYIQDIEGTSNITKNFIAIQIVAELDNFLGSMYFVGIRKFRGVEFELERQQPVDQ